LIFGKEHSEGKDFDVFPFSEVDLVHQS